MFFSRLATFLLAVSSPTTMCTFNKKVKSAFNALVHRIPRRQLPDILNHCLDSTNTHLSSAQIFLVLVSELLSPNL